MQKNHYKKFRKKSNILLTCEHGSKRIPHKFGRLGLNKNDLENSKDWFDLGAFEVMRNLERKLGASYIYSNISRLVVDYNRRLNGKNKNNNKFHSCPMKPELLVERNGKDEIMKIPANNFDSESRFLEEEEKRFHKYVTPYRKDGYELIDKMKIIHEKSYVIMIHSFAPFYNGDKRNVDIGVLHFNFSKSPKKIIKSLKKNTNFIIGDNSPWDVADADGTIFHRVREMNDVQLIVFDINNKNLRNKSGINKISNAVAKSLKEVIVN